MSKKQAERISISLRLECRSGSTIAHLLKYVRDEADLEPAESPVPFFWGDRVTLALDSFWWPDALSASGNTNHQIAHRATLSCIKQLEHQIVVIRQIFQLADDEQGADWHPELKDHSRGGKVISVTYRFQPRIDSKIAILLDWVRSPFTNVMHSENERGILAFTAFWLPFALRHLQGVGKDELIAAAKNSIFHLHKRISELRATLPALTTSTETLESSYSTSSNYEQESLGAVSSSEDEQLSELYEDDGSDGGLGNIWDE